MYPTGFVGPQPKNICRFQKKRNPNFRIADDSGVDGDKGVYED